jgi:hypothetical protein
VGSAARTHWRTTDVANYRRTLHVFSFARCVWCALLLLLLLWRRRGQPKNKKGKKKEQKTRGSHAEAQQPAGRREQADT